MKSSSAVLAVSVLFFTSLLAAPPENADSKAPDTKAATRLKFQAYDGDAKKPESMSFQINTIDLRQPSEFLKLGDTISKTNFKLTKFVFKQVPNPSTGRLEDLSELTIQITPTNQEFVLVLGQLTTFR